MVQKNGGNFPYPRLSRVNVNMDSKHDYELQWKNEVCCFHFKFTEVPKALDIYQEKLLDYQQSHC